MGIDFIYKRFLRHRVKFDIRGPVLSRMKIRITAPVYPTESRERVAKAIMNLFAGADLSDGERNGIAYLEGGASNLDSFAELLAKQKIRDTARAFLMRRVRGNKLSFSLNKQAAFAGRINFVEDEVPLGAISVTVEHDKPERLVEIITHIPQQTGGGGE